MPSEWHMGGDARVFTWRQERFEGNTLLECLQAAVKGKKERFT